MAALSHSESKRLYSWWWDSHNSPKNSKWLQDNLTDIDSKVNFMIKLLEEDADSFARRAEMYYKKRPELMKLVEEFYRAYRALAERYNHATGELRHAHRTLAKAFPDQVPAELVEDSPSKPLAHNKEPHTPETKIVRALFGKDDLLDDAQELKTSEGGRSIKGLKLEKEKDEGFHDEVLKLSNENQCLKDEVLKETERAGKAESEVERLKGVLSDIQAEKEGVLLQYQRCLAELSSIEGELSNAKKDSVQLNEKATRAEIEVQTLKETLVELEAEKNAGVVKHEEYLEKISNLENLLSQIQENNKGLNASALEAKSEAQILNDDISRLEREREAVVQQYNQCLEKISVLENLISILESEAMLLKKQAEAAENEVSELKQSLADLNKEKEASALKYKCCIETISKLERDVSNAKEEVRCLNSDVLTGNLKLKTAEEKCLLLEMSNRTLKTEAENLAKEIALKDQQLSQKQEELENLQTSLQDEHLHHAKVEATLQSLQEMHSQSQDDQRALTLELENVLLTLKDLEVSKLGLQEEIRQVQEEKQSLHEANLSSVSSMENMQNEVLALREVKGRLEKEVSHHIALSDSLQQEIMRLKEEIEGLNGRYRALVEQVEAAGLSSKCVGSSIKSLQDENLKLREMIEEGNIEKEIQSKKLKNLQELLDNKVVLESSLSRMSSELESSQEKVQALQESCQFLHGDKATLASEKASLMSQLQAMTENMHNLLEKNAVLEDNLSTAKVELEGLREKSRGLEKICELLKDERTHLLNERSSLAIRLETVEKRLENLEKKYTGLEEKYANLEKEKEAVHCQVEELKVSVFMEKQERTSSQLQSDTRLAGLENQIHFLKEENGWKKKEYEEELEKFLKAQFEMSTLHKFIKDMEEKNCSLIIECQKHVEASKLAEKLISELESESLEQQVEAELLLDEIERLRLSIYEVFRALETGSNCHDDKIENEQTFVHKIVGAIEDMKCSISKQEDHKQLLVVENSVLLTLLEQMESKGIEIELQRVHLEQEFKTMAEGLAMAENEKDKLLQLNSKLKSDVSDSRQQASILEAELESLSNKQSDLHKSYSALEDAYVQVNKDNTNLLKKFSDLKEEKYQVDQHNNAALLECLEMTNLSVILRSLCEEKTSEVKVLLNDLSKQQEINCSLERAMSALAEKLELQKVENSFLKDAVLRLEGEMLGMREYNIQVKEEVISCKENLLQSEGKLFDTEMKLQIAENDNLKLCGTVDGLKTDIQESMQIKENLEKDIIRLVEVNSIQEEEMESLNVIKTSFETELSQLREQLEEKIMREQALCSDLQEKNNEFELWEAEATGFYFDLQISSIHEVLFKNKVQELTGVCRTLEDENASKTSDIEQMKGEICSMENEISGLKSQLYAYDPVIAALREDVMILEQSALLQSKLESSRRQEPEILEASADPSTRNSDILLEDESLVSLQSLRMRVKTVGKLMEEMNKPVVSHGRSISRSKQESAEDEVMEQVKSRRCLGRDKYEHSRKKGQTNEITNPPKLQKIKTKASESRNGMLIKDIPLDQVTSSSLKGIRKKSSSRADDQMLELWETAEERRDVTIGDSLRMPFKMTDKDIVYDEFENVKRMSDPPFTDSDVEKELGEDKWEIARSSSELKREVSGRRVLERLSSDAQKLENLQATVQNLRSKLESNKMSRKTKNMDFETVQEQLLEAEETVLYLVDLNGQLVKNIEECPSPDGKASPQKKEAAKTRRRKITEQARKGSERIGRLQLELQKIQYILLKMEEEKKNKGRNKFFKSKSIVVRDFIYNGRRNSGRRKKGPLCGCFRPSSSGNGSSP